MFIRKLTGLFILLTVLVWLLTLPVAYAQPQTQAFTLLSFFDTAHETITVRFPSEQAVDISPPRSIQMQLPMVGGAVAPLQAINTGSKSR